MHICRSPFKVKTTCAVSHSNKREPGGWQVKTGINRISGREEAYQQCAAQKPEWFLFPAAPVEWLGQCGETSWNHSQGSSWECGNNIKINALVFSNLLPSGEPCRSLDKVRQLGIPPYCSKWLAVWHRPCTVATLHILSHSHPLCAKRIERMADKTISKSQAFSLSGKQYKMIVWILFKCLLSLLAFGLFFLAGAPQFWRLFLCKLAKKISYFLFLSL